MYAVICSGGKQYRVNQGDVIDVEKLNAEIGAEMSFDALMLGGEGEVKIGAPLVDGAKVVAKVIEHSKGPKIIVFKYKPKKGYKKTQGHRQPYTRLEVVSVG